MYPSACGTPQGQSRESRNEGSFPSWGGAEAGPPVRLPCPGLLPHSFLKAVCATRCELRGRTASVWALPVCDCRHPCGNPPRSNAGVGVYVGRYWKKEKLGPNYILSKDGVGEKQGAGLASHRVSPSASSAEPRSRSAPEGRTAGRVCAAPSRPPALASWLRLAQRDSRPEWGSFLLWAVSGRLQSRAALESVAVCL